MAVNRPDTDALIAALAERAAPVHPLAAPGRRGARALLVLLVAGGIAAAILGDSTAMLARYAGRNAAMVIELTALLLTATLAVIGAFALSVPGGSRRWLWAPLPSLLVWIAVAGAGCLGAARTEGMADSHGTNCLVFILAVGLAVAAPLFWRLSRAHPIDALPVALLGGVGSGAAAALLINFFHPFAVTPFDFAVHVGAIVLLVTLLAASSSRILAPTR